eukprot:jgi/Bigna1/134043/aug1.23_g8751
MGTVKECSPFFHLRTKNVAFCKVVLDWVTIHMKNIATKVSLVHVVEYPLTNAALKKGQEYLKKCTEFLKEKNFPVSIVKIITLNPPSSSVKIALCEYSNEVQPDVIVCGSRGLGYMGRTFLGSVSDYLVHNAKCTVMVVKDEFSSKQPEKDDGTESMT